MGVCVYVHVCNYVYMEAWKDQRKDGRKEASKQVSK